MIRAAILANLHGRKRAVPASTLVAQLPAFAATDVRLELAAMVEAGIIVRQVVTTRGSIEGAPTIQRTETIRLSGGKCPTTCQHDVLSRGTP